MKYSADQQTRQRIWIKVSEQITKLALKRRGKYNRQISAEVLLYKAGHLINSRLADTQKMIRKTIFWTKL